MEDEEFFQTDEELEEEAENQRDWDELSEVEKTVQLNYSVVTEFDPIYLKWKITLSDKKDQHTQMIILENDWGNLPMEEIFTNLLKLHEEAFGKEESL